MSFGGLAAVLLGGPAGFVGIGAALGVMLVVAVVAHAVRVLRARGPPPRDAVVLTVAGIATVLVAFTGFGIAAGAALVAGAGAAFVGAAMWGTGLEALSGKPSGIKGAVGRTVATGALSVLLVTGLAAFGAPVAVLSWAVGGAAFVLLRSVLLWATRFGTATMPPVPRWTGWAQVGKGQNADVKAGPAGRARSGPRHRAVRHRPGDNGTDCHHSRGDDPGRRAARIRPG